eukprot:scaffold2706_cov109-Isochrysis_galbana.AAC.7
MSLERALLPSRSSARVRGAHASGQSSSSSSYSSSRLGADLLHLGLTRYLRNTEPGGEGEGVYQGHAPKGTKTRWSCAAARHTRLGDVHCHPPPRRHPLARVAQAGECSMKATGRMRRHGEGMGWIRKHGGGMGKGATRQHSPSLRAWRWLWLRAFRARGGAAVLGEGIRRGSRGLAHAPQSWSATLAFPPG